MHISVVYKSVIGDKALVVDYILLNACGIDYKVNLDLYIYRGI